MNLIAIAGRLGSDAEIRTTPTGKPVANFDVAVKDGRDNTIWFRCALWGDRAERLVQYLTKGQGVAVSGSIRLPDVWTNRESGEPRARNSLFVDRVTFTGGGEDSGERTRAQDTPRKPEPVTSQVTTEEQDEVPF